jgi:hypothetical protein
MSTGQFTPSQSYFGLILARVYSVVAVLDFYVQAVWHHKLEDRLLIFVRRALAYTWSKEDGWRISFCFRTSQPRLFTVWMRISSLC